MKREIPDEVEIVIDVPRLGCIKRREDGTIDYVSPFPCPFNYGHVPGRPAEDGEHQDAIVLGPPLARGQRVRSTVRGLVDFVDDGLVDTKWVCSDRPLSRSDRRTIVAFFRVHVMAKTMLNAWRGRSGRTRFGGFRDRPGRCP